MAYFSIIVHGSGICIYHDADAAAELGVERRIEDDTPIIGFYTTRFVAGANMDDAIAVCLSLILDDWSKPPLSRLNKNGKPQLEAEDVAQVGLVKYMKNRSRKKGFTFYTAVSSEGEDLN